MSGEDVIMRDDVVTITLAKGRIVFQSANSLKSGVALKRQTGILCGVLYGGKGIIMALQVVINLQKVLINGEDVIMREDVVTMTLAKGKMVF